MVLARNSRYLQRCSASLTKVCHLSSESSTSKTTPESVVQPTAPLFNRRERKKLRNAFPRPDKVPQALYPALPASFVNRITMADGSSFYLTTRSPRSAITLARDVTNHPLWNPSLAREVADQDQSGRMGRFERRYGGAKLNPTPENAVNPQAPVQPASEVTKKSSSLDQHGFGVDDLDWISGQSHQSFYGVGNAKNIKGMKKSPTTSKK